MERYRTTDVLGPNLKEWKKDAFRGADGIQLFYRKVGTGNSTAVYLHGGPLSLADGGYSLDALAVGRTLLVACRSEFISMA